MDKNDALYLRFPAGLRFFLAPQHRGDAPMPAAPDGTSTLGHLVEAAGVPLTEVGGLRMDGEPVPFSHIPEGGGTVEVEPVGRPQALPPGPAAFLLDVHFGSLARRLRLLGVDTAYHNDMDDPALVVQANAERRVLLTQDRGLLRRKNLWCGAYVRGTRAEAQLDDVLRRFAPGLAPWTRCTACNGLLQPVTKDEVAAEIEDGTRRTQDVFARCRDCGQVYWRGAHHARLEAVVAEALRTVSAARAQGAPWRGGR
ncbi:Mut7-C RNAse domain-containing protein [Streptomyces sp. NPDC051940]|uniref:Mut7-C RNAse domain-containing protein n=1 Tax=Streptomyces sp. NPDC051940 TaxID=3155675 RepID=UPI00344426CB